QIALAILQQAGRSACSEASESRNNKRRQSRMAATAGASSAGCRSLVLAPPSGSVQLLVGGRRYVAPIDQLRRASPVFARMLSPDWRQLGTRLTRRSQFLVLHETPDCVVSFGPFLTACLLADDCARVAEMLPADSWPLLAGVLLLADKYLADSVRLACETVLCDRLLNWKEGDNNGEDSSPWWLAEFADLRWLRLGRACSICLRLAAGHLPSLLLLSESDCLPGGRAFLASLQAGEFAQLLAASPTAEAAADALIAACEFGWPAVDSDESVRACLAGLLSRGHRPAELLLLLSGCQIRRLRQLRPNPVDAEWLSAVESVTADSRGWFRLRLVARPGGAGRMTHDSRLFYTAVAGPADSPTLSVRFHFLPAASGCTLWAAPVEPDSGRPVDLHRLTAPPVAEADVGLRQLDYGCWSHEGTVSVLPGYGEVSAPMADSDIGGCGQAWMLVCLEPSS
ncbi:hypothetical protein BOX15_Mlig032010g3, partial [Macrostomum lignano]